MRILFIAPRYTGGNGILIKRIARMLSGHGFEVSLLRAPHMPIKNAKNPSFAVLGAARALASRKRYDVVHAFNVPSAPAMRCARAKRRVLSINGVFSDQMGMIHAGWTGRLARAAESVAVRWADRLLTDSEDSRARYREALGADFEFIASPLDPGEFEDLPDVQRKRQVAYVGRDSYEKGIDILRSVEDRINADVVYCTDLPWREAMTRLKESSVVAVPSRAESMPQVVLEALYLGVPVVGSGVGDIPRVVEHGISGLIVPPGEPARLAGSINRLLDDGDLAGTLARNGRRRVMESLTCDAMLPRYVRFYEELLESQA